MRLLPAVMLASPLVFQHSSVPTPTIAKVEFEDDRIRVLRVHYEPRQAAAIRDHPAELVVTLGSSIKREVFSDGTSRELRSEPGTVKWMDSGRRATENESDEALEELEIELKRANAPAAIVSPRSTGAPLLEEPMPANREPIIG